MQQLLDVLNAKAMLDADGIPSYKADFNGFRVSIDVQTRHEFDASSAAFAEAQVLVHDLLRVPGWVAISIAEIGALVDAFPDQPGSDPGQWRGRVQLVFTTEALAAREDYPTFQVSGLRDEG